MYKIVELSKNYRQQVLDLIATDHLRPEGILDEGTRYWGAFCENELAGVIGCEYEGAFGLLRSALVHKKYRSQGIAGLLTETLISTAKDEKLEAVYLFSTDAGGYWTKLGFKPVGVAEVIEKLSHAPQVNLFRELGWLPTEAAYKLKL